MIKELENKIGQLQYEISLLGHSEEDLTGVTIRTDELKDLVKNINYTRCCKSDSEQLKVDKVKEFWQFKNSYLIDKQLNRDPFGFRKDLTDNELVDKYALYLKNNL